MLGRYLEEQKPGNNISCERNSLTEWVIPEDLPSRNVKRKNVRKTRPKQTGMFGVYRGEFRGNFLSINGFMNAFFIRQFIMNAFMYQQAMYNLPCKSTVYI